MRKYYLFFICSYSSTYGMSLGLAWTAPHSFIEDSANLEKNNSWEEKNFPDISVIFNRRIRAENSTSSLIKNNPYYEDYVQKRSFQKAKEEEYFFSNTFFLALNFLLYFNYSFHYNQYKIYKNFSESKKSLNIE